MSDIRVQGESEAADKELFTIVASSMASMEGVVKDLAGVEIVGQKGDVWFTDALHASQTHSFACLRIFKNGKGHIRFSVAVEVADRVDLVNDIIDYALKLDLLQLYTYALDSETWEQAGFEKHPDKKRGRYVLWTKELL